MHDLSPAPRPMENAIRWSFPLRVCLARVIISTNLNYAPGCSIISEASDGEGKKEKKTKTKCCQRHENKNKRCGPTYLSGCAAENFCGKTADLFIVITLAKYS